MARIQQSEKGVSCAASDQILRWMESISGLLTFIRTQYGGVSELIEHPTWDESKNNYALAMAKSLKKEMAQLAEEFSEHVDRYQKVL